MSSHVTWGIICILQSLGYTNSISAIGIAHGSLAHIHPQYGHFV